jgi:hypothetical protein
MVLSIIFLEDKHKILFHFSIFYEYQQFFQHRIFSDFYVNLRVEVGKHPQVILAMYFFFILDKNNERPDWMTDW